MEKSKSQNLLELLRSLDPNKAGGREMPPDTVIWRYMSVGKFLSLVMQRKLFFPSLELLRKSDPAEGRFRTEREWVKFNAQVHRLAELASLSEPRHTGKTVRTEANLEKGAEERKLLEEIAGKIFFISSWYMHTDENASMWKMYGREGIAIQSTVKQVRDGITAAHITILPKAVSYVVPSEGSALDWAFHKRHAYRDEKEFRFLLNFSDVIMRLKDIDEGLWKSVVIHSGVAVDFDLSAINQVVVAPGNNSWLRDALRNVVNKEHSSISILDSEVETLEN